MNKATCMKCGHEYVPGAMVKYCSCCGNKLPEYNGDEEVACPCCKGSGKVTRKFLEGVLSYSPVPSAVVNN